ncbi:hypothetical protein NPIL_34491 [Nephila pilipes]|uniref:Uncharacterized protein n=1 Tax=Nephila pilipes TaxID=299642 RepID=A0A8X6N8T8_NEPPI|nr:hypothetical protein NPIL_34491 [Nephila pilipes]
MGSSSRLEVQLDEVDISTLDSKFFEGFKVLKLDISHSQLDSLAEEEGKALTSLQDSAGKHVINVFSRERGTVVG